MITKLGTVHRDYLGLYKGKEFRVGSTMSHQLLIDRE
jgi:hypothetical protein